MKSVLITGIGGTRSIAVLKALRLSNEKFYIVGTDANYFNPGSYQCDAAYTLPFVTDAEYMPRLIELIDKEKIGIIFATTEKEVAFLAKQKAMLATEHYVTVVVPDSEILDICFDKYKTQEFLETSGFVSIPTIYAGDQAEIDTFVAKHGYPLVRKPIFGYGSKGLSIINNKQELDAAGLDAEYVLQKFIENSNSETYYNLELNEYTTEIFVHTNGSIAGGIILKRALRSGETVAAYLIKDDSILEYLKPIALKLGIKGPVNFQFRINNGQIYIFEINPLFSGTTAVRASLGFNSVALAIQSFLDHKYEQIEQDQLQEKYVMRYLEEVYVEPSDLEELKSTGEIKRHG